MSFSNNIDNLQKLKYNISDRVHVYRWICFGTRKSLLSNITTHLKCPYPHHLSTYQVLNFSFDPESNGDTNAPNGIDPAFFQDQVVWSFNQSHVLTSWFAAVPFINSSYTERLRSIPPLKDFNQDGSQHLIFGGGRIWMTELNPQTGKLTELFLSHNLPKN